MKENLAMIRVSLLMLALAPTVLAVDFTVADDATPPAAEWISQDALIVVEMPEPRKLIERLFEERVVKAITASPPYKEQAAKAEFQQAANLVKYFEDKYQAELPELLGRLLGGGLTWALGPDEASILIVDCEDEQFLSEIHEFILLMARNQAQEQGDPGRVTSAEYRGLTGWRFGPNEAHAIVGSRLLLTNKPELLKSAADLRAAGGQPCLATSSDYQAARQAAGADALVSAYINSGVLKQIPDLNKALRQYENPLAALLFAPLATALRDSTWLAMGLDLEDDTIAWRFVTDGVPSDPSEPDGFAAMPTPEDGALPCPTVPGQIASLSFYRDMYKFYGAKDELFPERTSGLIFFENMMGIFFTGRDLTEEVLAEIAPDIRLVVAQQQYDTDIGVPQMQLPSFGAILRMRDAKKFARVVEEAWQKGLGLINFTRGQQALPGLIIDRPTHGDTKYTMAYFAAPDADAEADVDVRFNFQPTLAMPGDYVIFSSTDALARDLIDAVQQEASAGAKPVAGLHSALEIDGAQLASILDANRDALVRQNMVEEGNTREEAEAAIGLLLKIANSLRHVKLNAGSSEEQSQATLEVTVQLP
jgi:hypothetical protein